MRTIRRPLALGGAILGLILLVPLTQALGANSPRSIVHCRSFLVLALSTTATIANISSKRFQ